MTSKHFLYAIRGDAPSPTGNGTAKGWLEHYKLNTEGLTYVIWTNERVLPEKGDWLWFQIDRDVVGRVQVNDVFTDPMSDRMEIWYDAEDIQRIKGLKSMLTQLVQMLLSDEVIVVWAKFLLETKQ